LCSAMATIVQSTCIVDGQSPTPHGGDEERCQMVIAVIDLMPRAGQSKAMLEILRFVAEHTRSKPECLGCSLLETADGGRQLRYEEHWQATKHLHAHIQSGLYSHILRAMELASEEPKISFYEVTQTRSMELVVELRS
jgi:quinol monooxygenase YgiN